MRKINSLKADARATATWRGHDLFRFETLSNTTACAMCKKCGMEVFVDANPAPNGIDISGQAVALTCNRGTTS